MRCSLRSETDLWSVSDKVVCSPVRRPDSRVCRCVPMSCAVIESALCRLHPQLVCWRAVLTVRPHSVLSTLTHMLVAVVHTAVHRMLLTPRSIEHTLVLMQTVLSMMRKRVGEKQRREKERKTETEERGETREPAAHAGVVCSEEEER
jgi:hypothetical protein